MQHQLFVDTFAAVVAAALPSLTQNKSTWVDVEESMIGGLVAALASGGKKSPSEQLSCASGTSTR